MNEAQNCGVTIYWLALILYAQYMEMLQGRDSALMMLLLR